MMLACPQCGQAADSGRQRLVQDSCGHRKCRECLLSDEASCWSCSSPVYTELQPAPAPSIVPQTPHHALDEEEQSAPPENCATLASDSTASEEVSEQTTDTRTELLQPQQDVNADTDGGKTHTPANIEPKDCVNVKDSVSAKKRQHLGLKEHIIFTPGDPPMYHCKICKKSYNNRKAARYHNYCGLPDTFKPHRCDICGQGFVTSGHFSYHMKSHSGSLPFLCEICQKGFKQSSKLKRHMRSHEGEKPFKCDVCGRFFSAKHVLKDHMMLHSGNHILSCSVCNKKFSSKSCLRKHKLLHSDPTHKCDYCGKKFPVKWNLEMHRKTHLRERRHKCKQCNRAFKILSDLKRHASVHLEDGEWICEICKIVFRRKDNLVRHLKNIHPESQLDGVNTVEHAKNVNSDSAQCGISNPSPPSQAVSVIRGTAVPVIQKMGDFPSLTNSTHQNIITKSHIGSAMSSPRDPESMDSVITFEVTQKSADNSIIFSHLQNSGTSVNPFACIRTEENDRDQPTVMQDQNFLRESVVCHSGARGVVHYGSVAYVNDRFPISHETMEVTQTIESVKDSGSLNVLPTSDVDRTDGPGSSFNIVRPRVIVEKINL